MTHKIPLKVIWLAGFVSILHGYSSAAGSVESLSQNPVAQLAKSDQNATAPSRKKTPGEQYAQTQHSCWTKYQKIMIEKTRTVSQEFAEARRKSAERRLQLDTGNGKGNPSDNRGGDLEARRFNLDSPGNSHSDGKESMDTGNLPESDPKLAEYLALEKATEKKWLKTVSGILGKDQVCAEFFPQLREKVK